MKHRGLNHFGCSSQMICRQGVCFLHPRSGDERGLGPRRDPIAPLQFSHFESQILPIQTDFSSQSPITNERCRSPCDGNALLNVAVALKIGWLVHWKATETLLRPRLGAPCVGLFTRRMCEIRTKGARQALPDCKTVVVLHRNSP